MQTVIFDRKLPFLDLWLLVYLGSGEGEEKKERNKETNKKQVHTIVKFTPWNAYKNAIIYDSLVDKGKILVHIVVHLPQL